MPRANQPTNQNQSMQLKQLMEQQWHNRPLASAVYFARWRVHYEPGQTTPSKLTSELVRMNLR